MWVRTGGGLMGLGFVIDRFGFFLQISATKSQASLAHGGLSFWFGAGFVLFGLIVNTAAAAH
jgi:putative membrane protein